MYNDYITTTMQSQLRLKTELYIIKYLEKSQGYYAFFSPLFVKYGKSMLSMIK